MKIGHHNIDNNTKPFVIAEVAQAHDGSLGMAHSFIDAASKAGADAIKFQTHIATAESTIDEPFRINFSYQDKSRYDYWQRMEFTEEQWNELANHCKDRGIIFLSSPFSIKAVELLERLNIDAWKIGSGEFKSLEMLEEIIKTKKPILYSTGMSSWDEIDTAVKYFNTHNADFVLLQCTSMYPTPLNKIGINVIDEFKSKYNCLVGLSDHSGTIYPALLSLFKKVQIVELHVTFDKNLFGPDAKASLNFSELSQIIQARDHFFEIEKNPVDKDQLAIELQSTRELFNRSLAFLFSQKKGTVIKNEMLTTKKPGNGIDPKFKMQILGKTLQNDVRSDQLLSWEDIKK